MRAGPARIGGMLAGIAWLIALPAWGRDLVVGVEAIDYSPLYGVRDGKFQGAARQILDAFAADHGYRLTYLPLPVKRLYAELIHGGIDFKFPDSPDWQPALRQGVPVVFSHPMITYIDGTIVRKDMAGGSEAAIHQLGTIAGFTPYAWGGRLKAGTVELRENSSIEQLLRQVVTGRIDGAYVNVAVALNTAKSVAGLAGQLAYAPGLPHVADSYRLSTVKDPALIAEFDQWLSKNAKQVADIITRTDAELGIR